MKRSRRLAVASSRFRIFFYDSSFSSPFITYLEHKSGTPLCIGYHASESHESDGRGKEILMVGDSLGFVTVYPMDDKWTSHKSNEKKKNEQENSKERSAGARTKVKHDAFRDNALPCKSLSRTQYHHGEWVTQVGFVHELQAMVTCGLDGCINLCDIHANQTKREPITVHKKGVHTWLVPKLQILCFWWP
jgi:hypothetical protein